MREAFTYIMYVYIVVVPGISFNIRLCLFESRMFEIVNVLRN